MRMNHKNVLRVEGVAPNLFTCCMISRWMDNGNMLDYLTRHQGAIDRLELVSTDSDRVFPRFAYVHQLLSSATGHHSWFELPA